MRNSNTLPFRSLRDLVLKELQQDKSLLTWNNDASFTHNTLATLLASEAYLLDRSAVEYLGDLAQGLTIEDYYRSIAHTRMPFPSVWIEMVFPDTEHDAGDISYGALIRETNDGISVFTMFMIHMQKPWMPIYSGTEVLFCQDGQVICSTTPIANLHHRIGPAAGHSVEELLNDDVDKALRLGGIFALMCAVLERPRILEREAPQPLRKSEAKMFERISQKPPSYALSVIRLSKAGRIERDAQHQSERKGGFSSRVAHWVRGHVFLARNGKLTWRRAHVRGEGLVGDRVHRVTK
ncbi:MAG: hypothetical protein NZ734_06260 [Paracoccus sp.]|nr:hypothetical protein [Paracoccus sp. (in: a-proteobacteria)]